MSIMIDGQKLHFDAFQYDTDKAYACVDYINGYPRPLAHQYITGRRPIDKH